MEKVIGIDIGFSIIKVAHCEDGEIILEMYRNKEIEKLIRKLKEMTDTLHLTGGYKRYNHLLEGFKKKEIDEFEAIFLGIKHLIGKRAENSLIVSMGTGTSFLKIENNKVYRVGGTALGGGTIIGLSKLLLKTDDYGKISKYAEKGDRTNIDILVRDIYPHGMEHLDGSLTASNFGKAKKKGKEDMARAIFQMVGENIAIMSALYAKNHELSEIFYIGTPVKDNDILRSILQTTTKLMKMHGYFIPSGEYAGALGAYLYGR